MKVKKITHEAFIEEIKSLQNVKGMYEFYSMSKYSVSTIYELFKGTSLYTIQTHVEMAGRENHVFQKYLLWEYRFDNILFYKSETKYYTIYVPYVYGLLNTYKQIVIEKR